MTDASSLARAAELWTRLWFPSAWLAPRQLMQPINPGWIFGNLIVNERNSSAPSTELAIIAEESYGRQIGKLLDAVYELSRESPEADSSPAFREIAKLRENVERLKREAAAERIEQLRRDLELLRDSDTSAYEEKVRSLREVLPVEGASRT